MRKTNDLNFYLPTMKKWWILGCVSVLISCTSGTELTNVEIRGEAQGSTYQIRYLSAQETDLRLSIDSIFEVLDQSMSTYKANSLISKLNQNGQIAIDHHFSTVLQRAEEIAIETKGMFDPTVGPLVEFWGFGSRIHASIDSAGVDSVRDYIGYSKVMLDGDFVRIPTGFRLDFNAIAQGYTVDVLGDFLEGKGINRFMVEVGGEVNTRGLNGMDQPWRIGVDKPNEEIDHKDRFQMILGLSNLGLATSGNYRKFWIDDETGIKYAHTIDPLTGYPAGNKLLSVTIIAKSTMDADAYATVCMVMGREDALNFIESKGEIEGYFISSDVNGNWQVDQTSGFANYLVKK